MSYPQVHKLHIFGISSTHKMVRRCISHGDNGPTTRENR